MYELCACSFLLNLTILLIPHFDIHANYGQESKVYEWKKHTISKFIIASGKYKMKHVSERPR